MNTKNTAMIIVSEILNTGLSTSTWKETHPIAYRELLEYRDDMETSVIHVLDEIIKRDLI